jgi:hypothetical protein
MPLEFTTISVELTEYAERAGEQARANGYRLAVEPEGPYFPVRPTLLAYAAQRELIIEVVAKVSFNDSKKWMAYGRAQRKETKVQIVAPPQKKHVSPEEIERFQTAGIGLSVGNAGNLVHLVVARDLSTEIVCPDISKSSRKVRNKLGPCFQKISRGDIVDGFKDVAVIVEAAARKHLIAGVNSGRIQFATKTGKPINHGVNAIRQGTMGWLRDRFGEIVKPNGVDNIIRQAFVAVTPDRNVVSHDDLSAARRRALHTRIAKHLLVLHQAARELL